MSRKTTSKPAITLSEAGPCGFVPVFKVTQNTVLPLDELRHEAHYLASVLNNAGFVVEDTFLRPVRPGLPLTEEIAAQIPN